MNQKSFCFTISREITELPASGDHRKFARKTSFAYQCAKKTRARVKIVLFESREKIFDTSTTCSTNIKQWSCGLKSYQIYWCGTISLITGPKINVFSLNRQRCFSRFVVGESLELQKPQGGQESNEWRDVSDDVHKSPKRVNDIALLSAEMVVIIWIKRTTHCVWWSRKWVDEVIVKM